MKKKHIILIIIIIILSIKIHKNHEANQISEYMKKYNELDSGTVILNYHEVKKDNFFQKITTNKNLQMYNIPLSKFKKEINFIIENDINVISMDELNENMKNQKFNEKNVVITFDDIDRSVYENAYPILKENKIPFTSFIVTDHVGDTIDEREYASWDEIEKMNESGLQTVGVHTHKMHFKKNGEPIFLNENNIDEFEKDLELSQNEFEKQLGYKPIYFAYPYGYGNPKTDEVLLNHGIEMIFSLNEGIVTKETKNFYMPRILITKDNEKYVANWFLKN